MNSPISYAFNPNGEEAFSRGTLDVIRRLNRTVHESGDFLEGNLCYFNKAEDYVDQPPDPRRGHRRRNLLRAVRGKRCLLEIGFNAGHSALLALAAEPTLRYVGVDICRHVYVKPCAEIMKELFGDRFELIPGDSLSVLPRILAQRPDIEPNLFHVDGGHGTDNCIADIENSIRLARGRRGVHILVDDTRALRIREVVFRFVNTGDLATETYGGDWEGVENMCAAVLRRD